MDGLNIDGLFPPSIELPVDPAEAVERLLVDYSPDLGHQVLIELVQASLAWFSIDRGPRHLKPLAELSDRYLDAFGL